MAEFVTADLHFGDKRMLGGPFVRRPFESTAEMNNVLTKRWNAVVGTTDTVFVLGDMFGEKTWESRRAGIFRRLNGRKVLIKGNHDDHLTIKLPWVNVCDTLVIDREGVMFSMSHRPPARKLLPDAVVHLHGHLHSKEASMPIYDVGVDAHDFRPIPMDELVAKALRYQQSTDKPAAFHEQGRTYGHGFFQEG